MQEFYRLKPGPVIEQISNQQLKHWWVAERSGVHRTTLRRWLSGKIVRVRRDRVGKLAEALGSPIEILADAG